MADSEGLGYLSSEASDGWTDDGKCVMCTIGLEKAQEILVGMGLVESTLECM